MVDLWFDIFEFEFEKNQARSREREGDENENCSRIHQFRSSSAYFIHYFKIWS